MTPEQELRSALAEKHPDWHPELQKLIQAYVAELEAALRDASDFLSMSITFEGDWEADSKSLIARFAALAGDGGSARPARPDGPARRPPPPPPVDIEPQTEFAAGDDWRWPGDGGGA